MDGLALLQPSLQYADEIMAYRQEFLDEGHVALRGNIEGASGLHAFERAGDWLALIALFRDPLTVPPDRVPQDAYLLVRQSDGRVLGVSALRHSIDNEGWRLFGGHIGYGIRPSERRKGYGKAQLRLLLEEARRLGLGSALLTCRETNEPSRRTILACGGVYENSVFDPARGENMERYWIAL